MGRFTVLFNESAELYSIDQPVTNSITNQVINNPATTSNKTAGTASGTNWTTPSNTASSDNAYAVYNNTAQDYLKLTNFGFTSGDVPANATITGVTATIEGNATSGAGSATSSGPNSPTSTTDCTNQTGTGTVAWGTPTSCSTSNNGYVTASLDGTTSNWLRALNFGFAIPTTATINGITVEVERHSSGTGNGGIDDAAVRIVKGGTIGATNATLLTDWPTAVDTYYTYGSTSSLWGETWTPADINASNFGFALSATKASAAGAAITASVDHIRITVRYTTADGNTFDVCLTKDGTTCTGTEKTSQSLNQTTDTTTTKGSSADLWGATLTPSDVTSSNFGVMIQDANAVANALNFDQVQLTIDYTTPTETQISAGHSSTYSQKPDLVKDSDGNIQLVWQSWRSEGLSEGEAGASWRIATQKINNPSSGSVTKQYPATSDSWASAGTMNHARGFFTGTTLPNGKVIVSGGATSAAYNSSAELYDPYANTWTLTGPMNGSMISHELFTLKNGKVLAVTNDTTQNNHLYNPETNTWVTANNLNTVRSGTEAIMLNDGKILVAGGCDNTCSVTYSTSELYDPATGTWTYTANNIPSLLAYTKLIKTNDGSVLSFGGCTTGSDCSSNYTFTNAIYKYNPEQRTWAYEADLPANLYRIKAIKLNDGNILIFGGWEYDGLTSIVEVNYQWVYNPSSKTFTSLSTPPETLNKNGILLTNGNVLGFSSSTIPYLFNPQTQTWTAAASFTTSRSNPYTTLLKTGKVLMVGGSNVTSTAELYTPDPSEKLAATDDMPGSNHQTDPKIAADTANGTTYTAWTDSRLTTATDTTADKNIFMQRLSSSGNPTWPNGSGTNGTYNVRDVRVNNTQGVLETWTQSNVAMAKSIFDNNNGDGTYPLQLAWMDTKDEPNDVPINVYGQSYDTRDRTMTSTSWTAYYYVTGSPSNANSITVQVGATETDGETMSYTSAESTYTGDGTNGEKSTVFSNLPPSGETSLTHRRIIMKLTRSTGTMQIQYNGAAGVADTRLNTGMVVPERTLLLAVLIPLLPALAFYNSRQKVLLYKARKDNAETAGGKK